jgi:uncharacterized membrane protein YedE/YeeE
MEIVLWGLIIGLAWGVIFERTGVFEPQVILQQLAFKNFTMLKVMGSAIISSAIVFYAYSFFEDITLLIKPFDFYPNIFGGLIMGIGVSLTGACPGTVWAQLGVGYRNAFFIIIGGLLAASIYGIYLKKIETFFGTKPQGNISFVYKRPVN